MTRFVYTLVVFLLCLNSISQILAQEAAHPGGTHISSVFWTWQDPVIEKQDTLKAHILDLKNAGFQGLYAIPRSTRYHNCHPS